MILRWISDIFDTLLPRHADAVRARSVSESELAELMCPHILPGKKWVHALLPYHDERVRAVIKAIKYYGERQSAATVGALAADYILEVVLDQKSFEGWQDVVVVPIPSSPKRLKERGYNQAERITEAIVNSLDGVSYSPHLLAREDRTSQVHVMRSKRASNIKNAFHAVYPELVEGRFIILIDDVTESGATLADAKRALRDAGARDVIALAIAH